MFPILISCGAFGLIRIYRRKIYLSRKRDVMALAQRLPQGPHCGRLPSDRNFGGKNIASARAPVYIESVDTRL
jgi:hypothetical protein